MLFAVIILLSQALTIQANFLTADKPGDDAVALCAGKSIDLTTFEQLKALEHRSHIPSCSDTIKDALGELVRMIGSGMDDLCSVESVESMRAFYAQYLDTSADSQLDEKLPKSLRRFALAYGLQMSNYCKRNMIQILSKRGRELLSKEDFEQVEELTDDKGPVVKMLSSFIGTDDFFTPGELALFIKSSQRGGSIEEKTDTSDKIFMQTSTGPYVRKLQAVCERRFKPIYGPLIMPVSRLVNRGFNYRDDALKGSLESPDVVREVGQWARIVFLCEALTSIHIVEDQADQEAAEGTGGNLVRLVTSDEAAAIETTSQVSAIGGSDAGSLEMAVYLPEKKVLLGNKIYDRQNKELVAAVKSFKTSKTEQEIFRKKLVRKGLSMIKHEIRQGRFKLLMSTGYKGLLQHYKGGSQAVSPGGELVKALNDIQASRAEHPDGAVSFEDYAELANWVDNVKAVIYLIILIAFLAAVIYGLVVFITSLAG